MKKIPALVFSRIAGYFTPVYQGDKVFAWNPGKTSEYNDRKPYKVPEKDAVPYRSSTRKFNTL
jgi:hypothetical protein